MSPSTPLHRFKQPDGSRYPSTRPDGLVRQNQLVEILGIGETTLLRWQSNGWIAPEKKEGHCTLYRVPSPERIEEIKALTAKRQKDGAVLGRQRALNSGGNLLSAARGRESKTAQAEARVAEGLLNKRQLCLSLNVHLDTLNRWIEDGLITPARTSESKKWMWFTRPDDITLENLRSVAKGRTKSSLGIELAGKSEPKERKPRKPYTRKSKSITSDVRAKIKRGTCPAGTISFEEAAERAGVSKDTVIHWTEKGWLSFVRESRYVRGIVPEVLDTYLAERVRQKEQNTGRAAGPIEDSDALLSIAEVCECLGTTETTLRRWVKRGWIAPVGVVRYGALRFKNPTQDDIALIRQKIHEARAEIGRANAAHIATPESIQKRNVSRANNQEASRPNGCLSRTEVASELGLQRKTFDKHVQKGWISEVSDGWIHQTELRRYKAALEMKESVKSARPDRPRVSAPKVAPLPKPAPVPVAKPALPAGFIAYDVATKEGRALPMFQSALGFNLLAHPQHGFRPALVNEKPEMGWRYHERHFVNGFGQWQVKAQKPVTGEILL